MFFTNEEAEENDEEEEEEIQFRAKVPIREQVADEEEEEEVQFIGAIRTKEAVEPMEQIENMAAQDDVETHHHISDGESPVKQPITLHSPYPKPMVKPMQQDFKAFLTTPLPHGAGILQCQMIRDNELLNHFAPRYELYYAKEMRFMMVAKRKLNSTTYVVSMNAKELDENGPFFLGQMRKCDGNYILYDDGVRPSSSSIVRSKRKEIARVLIDPKAKQVVERTVVIPQCVETFDIKKPQWNPRSGSFSLNFYGRVKQASIKNFQLINRAEEQENIYLQFGKVCNQHYILDMQHPFSPLQAFMISLISFDLKVKS